MTPKESDIIPNLNQVNPANIFLFKVNNKNTRTRSGIYSKLTAKTPIDDVSWHVSDISMLTVNIFHTLIQCSVVDYENNFCFLEMVTREIKLYFQKWIDGFDQRFESGRISVGLVRYVKKCIVLYKFFRFFCRRRSNRVITIYYKLCNTATFNLVIFSHWKHLQYQGNAFW